MMDLYPLYDGILTLIILTLTLTLSISRATFTNQLTHTCHKADASVGIYHPVLSALFCDIPLTVCCVWHVSDGLRTA